ncbi:Vitamin B12-binding protein precursor [Rosistilla ulvae]|uniref:Vitamin B12-binding protein n=1 Tax=Rosistilla ulvae TaxID=1930277 RepID=A0A517M8B8_9BACT|nr:helical backbone metal receptor [Rosistilla ulvae]QDS91114.1 Vitamin B12-binding protein precursor [Rosistilla ulvae]
MNHAHRTLRFWLLPLLTLLAFAAGCRQETSNTHETSPSASFQTITDRLDREVPVQQPAQRIISLSPATTELLFALGLGDSVVGATKHCNFPPAALEIPRVGGGTLESISAEVIVAAQPDLVLCKWDYHQPLIESLDRLQVRSMAIGAKNLQELFEEARWIGKLTDRTAEAEALVSRMQNQQQHLLNVVSRVKHDPPIRVFYEVWDDPLMTAGPDSFIDELLTMAGLQNIVSDTAVRYPRISSETVLQGDPQLILAPTTHFETVDLAEIRSRPGWDLITAVTNQRIYLISGDEISRCGPRVLDALAEIIVAAYPETREDLQLDATDQTKVAP